jgi:uncharacterized protein involved in cysteine biosynthesis
MDEKTIKRSLNTSIVLCILCFLLCIVALIFHWVPMAIVMAAFCLLQAYMTCIWLHRKRHPHRTFNPKRKQQ